MRYFAKHASDPEGFAQRFKMRGTNLFNRDGRAAFEAFFMGDPIEGALNLQVAAETAYSPRLMIGSTAFMTSIQRGSALDEACPRASASSIDPYWRLSFSSIER
jgi:hypothetical protein